MSEKELLELGFTKEFSTDIIEDEPDFYYYVKDITDGLTFITNDNSEMEGKEWYVEFFDTEIPIRYYEYATVKMLLMLIEEGIVKTKQVGSNKKDSHTRPQEWAQHLRKDGKRIFWSKVRAKAKLRINQIRNKYKS